MALKSLDSNKASGPDGLNGAYIKKLWQFIVDDFLHMVKEFQITGSIPKGLNYSFIILIPKVDSPKVPGDYRPISLLNFTMKNLLKVLATY